VNHYDYYEWATDAKVHNTAEVFPLADDGDSWLGCLCGTHSLDGRKTFGMHYYRVRCENPQCPAQCSVCAGEFAPREAVAD
jgi:hypothetical protein